MAISGVGLRSTRQARAAVAIRSGIVLVMRPRRMLTCAVRVFSMICSNSYHIDLFQAIKGSRQ